MIVVQKGVSVISTADGDFQPSTGWIIVQSASGRLNGAITLSFSGSNLLLCQEPQPSWKYQMVIIPNWFGSSKKKKITCGVFRGQNKSQTLIIIRIKTEKKHWYCSNLVVYRTPGFPSKLHLWQTAATRLPSCISARRRPSTSCESSPTHPPMQPRGPWPKGRVANACRARDSASDPRSHLSGQIYPFKHQHQIWTDWTWQDKVWFVENSRVHGHREGGQEDEGTRGHRVWPKLKRRRSVHM